MSRYTLHRGDCLQVLREMPSESVHAVVTDPPYGISFMGNRWDYDVPAVEVWAECLRVLKPGGHLLAFAGTRTQHRMAVRIEDAGFDIRDMIAWVYGSGFPKSHNLEGDWDGWGTALKPALEPITVARKPIQTTVAENVQAHGTGALNVNGGRVGSDTVSTHSRGANGAFPKRPGETSAEQSGRKKDQRTGIDNSERVGRWPANMIHDGDPEVVSLFPEDAGAQAPPSPVKDRPAQVALGNGLGCSSVHHGDTGSAARFFYCAKASTEDREEGMRCSLARNNMRVNAPRKSESDKTKTVRKNFHPTVKPTDLMRYLVRLVTPPGGVVLDPYMGSGSTGKAAMLEGFHFIGIERDQDEHGQPIGYMAIAEARIAHAAARPRHMELAL